MGMRVCALLGLRPLLLPIWVKLRRDYLVELTFLDNQLMDCLNAFLPDFRSAKQEFWK